MKDALSYEDYISFRQEDFSKMDVISVGWESSDFLALSGLENFTTLTILYTY